MMHGTCSTCGCPGGLCTWAFVLLLIGGLVHALPPLYLWLSDLTGGTPIVQIVVGIVSVIVAIMCLASSKKGSASGAPTAGGSVGMGMR